jgi:hypothetical protein
MESRCVPRLGGGVALRCSGSYHQPCHTAARQALLAIKGVAELRRCDLLPRVYCLALGLHVVNSICIMRTYQTNGCWDKI